MNASLTNRRFPASEPCLKRPSARLIAAILVAACSFVLPLASQAQVTYAFTNLFVVPAGTGNIVSSANDRGLAYDSVSNLVYVSSSGGSIGAYDGTLGTYLGAFNLTGTSGGTFAVDQVGVASDGAIYTINLATTAASPNKIYRFSSWNSTYTTAFNGNALTNGASLSYTSGRVGDTFAVTGSGANTLLLAGVVGKPYFCLFYTLDGLNFTNTIINVPAGFTGPGGNEFGISFYTNNTFLVKAASSGGSTMTLIQFPLNYASQPVVTGTVLASTTLGSQYNNSTLLSYAPNAGLLATLTTAPTNCAVALFNATNVAGTSLLLNTNAYVSVAPGNLTGAVALGGKGGTNVVYWIDSGNALYAYGIATIPPIPPTISSAPIGGTSFTSITLGVTAGGTQPYAYFWQASSNDSTTESTFTNIPNAKTNLFTVTSGTNYYQVIITNIAGAVTSAPVQVAILKSVSNPAVTTLWTVAPGTYSFLPASGDATRGIAYDTNTERLVVAATSGLNVLDGNVGTNIGAMNMTGVTFGGLLGGPDQVAIADDGAVYAGNVVNGGGNFTLYRWAAPSTSNSVTANVAFNADPGSGNASDERWGDALAVRGAGAGTQIILGSRASAPGGTNVAFLTPNDGEGLSYSATLIAVTNVPAGFASYGISFGAGNTFWAKNFGGDLYLVGFETNTYTGWVIFDYVAGTQVPSGVAGLGVDPVNNILAMVDLYDTPNDLQLSQLTGTVDAPVLFDQAFLATANANGNDNAAVAIKYPRAYALSVNNGIVAVTYGVPSATVPSINTPPASTTAYTNVGALTISVGASGSLPLYYQWQFNSNNIPHATNSSYVITAAAPNVSGYYDVVVHNIAGSVTSAPALVTLVAPASNPLVTELWSIGPGTNGSYLTTAGYETRGLAYDPTTTNLLIADHYYIHVYAALTATYEKDINTAGIPTGGINGWTIDQIGVADDGIVYSANLSPDGTAFSMISYSQGSYGENYAYGGMTGGSDLNSQDPAGDRWGDTMAVRGQGAGTQILFGSYTGTNVALFTTPDGVNFMPQVIPVQNVPAGFSGAGIAFGPGNTFYCKGGHFYDLREIAFDTNEDVGTVLEDYVAPGQTPNDLTGIGVDITNNILGGVCFNDSPNDLQLYLLSGNTNTPALFEQDFFPAFNANSQEDAVVDLKGGLGFALDVNNGVVGFTYGLPAAPAVKLTSVSYLPGNVTINWNNTFDNHLYKVYSTTSLTTPSWSLLGTVTATNATALFTDTSTATQTRFYRVVSQ